MKKIKQRGCLLFVDLVRHEADADVRLDALWREVEHRPHLKV